MKYCFTLLVLMLPILVMAQVHNAENYNPGDQLHYMVCTMPDSPGSAGVSIIWDFHAQQDSGNGQRTTWILPDSATPGGIIISLAPAPTGGSKVFKTATQNFQTSVLIQPATYVFDSGALLIDRVMTYGLMDSNTFSSQLSIATNILMGSGTSNLTVDGTGTLMTPAGTFNNVLRVKRVIDNTDSIPGNSLRNLQVSYLWYDSMHTAPLFRVDSVYRTGTGFLQNSSHVSATAEYLQAIFPTAVKNTTQNDIKVTGNLSNAGLLLNADLNSGKEYSVNLFNASGQKVYSNTFTADGSRQLFNTGTQLPAGLYIMVITANNAVDAPMVTRLIKE